MVVPAFHQSKNETETIQFSEMRQEGENCRISIVGQGDTYAAALEDTESAIRFFIEHYGKEKFFEHIDSPTLDAYIAEASISV